VYDHDVSGDTPGVHCIELTPDTVPLVEGVRFFRLTTRLRDRLERALGHLIP
jgi:hypothetical protein